MNYPLRTNYAQAPVVAVLFLVALECQVLGAAHAGSALTRSDVLSSFAMLATVEVETRGKDTATYRANYEISLLFDAGRYRVEIKSQGDRVGLLEGLSVSFDGKESWVVLQASNLATVRSGEVLQEIPFPLPDPITLQYRALVETMAEAGSASRTTILHLAKSRQLRASLDSQAAVYATAASRRGSASVLEFLSSDKESGVLELERFGAEWVPAALSLSPRDESGSRVSWRVERFLEPGRAGGVQGVPEIVVFEATDPSQPLSSLSARYQVTEFGPVASVRAEDFRLNVPSAMAIYDEDTRTFLRSERSE